MTLDRKSAVYIRADRADAREVVARLKRARDDPRVLFLCVQSLDAASPETRQMVTDWLEEKLNGGPDRPGGRQE